MTFKPTTSFSRCPFSLGTLLALALTAGTVLAQDQEIREESRVTAVDVVVRYQRSGLSQWSSGQATPKNLSAGDFVVKVDGTPIELIGLEALEHQAESERSPWRQLFYVDCRATTTGELRRTAALLHRRLDALLALGPMGVVIAEPEPRVMLASTRERALLDKKLSELSLTGECRDDSQALRDTLLRTLEKPGDIELTRAQLVQATYDAELQVQRRSAVGLLNTLTDDDHARGAQKVVYLLHNGFDDGVAFYRNLDAGLKTAPAADTVIGFPAAARLIAAYGWTVVPCTQSVATAGDDEVALGPWVISLVSGKEQPVDPLDVPPPGVADAAKPWQTFLAGIRGGLRENRKPERADSYAELGRSLLGQKKWADAEDAFRSAIYHYDDASKTRLQEARAWLGLGQSLTGGGDIATGRMAIERAFELDASLRKASGELASTELGQRGRLLAALAQTTLGRPALDEAAFDAIFAELSRRIRLTFQIDGDPRGRLLPLEVKLADGTALPAPPFVRSATPEDVALGRLLMAVDEELNGTFAEDHGLDLIQAVGPGASRLDLGALAGDGEARLRWTILRGTEEGRLRVEHQAVEVPARAQRDDRHQLALPAALPGGYVAVLAEDLDEGTWGWYVKEGA